MLPNFASILPDFVNVSQEDIVHAFRTGNHKWLRSLPDKLSAEEVVAAKRMAVRTVHRSAWNDA